MTPTSRPVGLHQRWVVAGLLAVGLLCAPGAAQQTADQGLAGVPGELSADSLTDGVVEFTNWMSSVLNPGETMDLLIQHLPEGWIPGELGVVTLTGDVAMVSYPLYDLNSPWAPLVGVLSLGTQAGRVGMLDVRTAELEGDETRTRHRFGVRGVQGALIVDVRRDADGKLVKLDSKVEGNKAMLGGFGGFACVEDCVQTLFGLTGNFCPVLIFKCRGSPMNCTFADIWCSLTDTQTAQVFVCVAQNCF